MISLFNSLGPKLRLLNMSRNKIENRTTLLPLLHLIDNSWALQDLNLSQTEIPDDLIASLMEGVGRSGTLRKVRKLYKRDMVDSFNGFFDVDIKGCTVMLDRREHFSINDSFFQRVGILGGGRSQIIDTQKKTEKKRKEKRKKKKKEKYICNQSIIPIKSSLLLNIYNPFYLQSIIGYP